MAKKKYYQRKDDGLFETTRTVNGKRVRFRGKTCAEVDRKILAYNEEKKKGRKVPKIIDEWWAQHEKEVSVSTQSVYKCPIERISAAFPDYASKYTAMDVARYIREFEAKGYAAQTVGVELTVLKQIFSHAVLAGDIAVSPATEVKPGKNLRRKKRPALTVEQEKAVEAYRGEDWMLGLMLLYTGCRKGELLALTWQDVDRDAGVIHVTKKVNYATGRPVLEDHLKSANGKRDIPLLDALAKVLPKNRIGLIFPGPDGGLLQRGAFDRRWTRYRRACGLDGITPHQFRHSYATIMYEAGVDTKAAAAFLGDTEATLKGVYEELRQDHKQMGMDRLNAYLAQRKAGNG